MHPDQQLIVSLLANNHVGIQQIYDRCAPKVLRMIQQNSGSEDDGYDMLQESLVDIYHIARDRNFQLTTSIESFVLMVAKRKWLNHLKKNKQLEVTNSEESLFNSEDESEALYAEHLVKVEQERILMEQLNSLGERCQEIIKRCMLSKNQEKIAEALGLSYAYLRKKKSECLAKLSERMRSHPFFKLINHENKG